MYAMIPSHTISNRILVVAIGLSFAIGVAAQQANIQIATDLPCTVNVSVQFMAPADPCYMVPPTAPVTGAISAGGAFYLAVPTNQKVYEILVSYQGHQLFKYNCALAGPPTSFNVSLGSICSSAPGVTAMRVGWGKSLEGPNSWNYSYKIQLAMIP